MICRRWTIRATAARRAISLCLLWGMLLSVIPIPVSTSAIPAEKDRSQPFPCQNRPCGCRSAAQCWKKCCCFTDEQKLAWAKRNGVKAPEFVIAHARSQQSSKKLTLASTAQHHPRKQSCCTHTPKENCHQQNGQPDCRHEKETPRQPQVVIGIFAQECQGNKAGFSSLDWVIPTSMTTISSTIDVVGETPPTIPLLPVDVVISPPVPPPRSV